MTLHEAVEKVLQQTGHPMTAREIADEINRQKLYQRGDGNPVPTSQIHARVKNYRNLFNKSNGQISLLNFQKDDIQTYADDKVYVNPKVTSRPDLTLHEAIKKVLEQHVHPMTAQELADEVNRQNLYHRGDGEPVPSSQIRARVKNYPFMFERDGSIISLPLSQVTESKTLYHARNFPETIKRVNTHLYNLPRVTELESLILTIQLFIVIKQFHDRNAGNSNLKSTKSISELNEKLSDFELINEYPHLKDLILNYSHEFRKLPHSVLTLLLEAVDSLSKQEILDNLKEYINNSNYFDKSKSGEYITPNFINTILANITNPKQNEIVFDPFAGWCGTLIEAFAVNQKVKLIAQEVNLDIAELGKLNLMLNECTDFQVQNSDSIKSPTIDPNTANVIISDLPIGVGVTEDFDFDFTRYSDHIHSNSLQLEMMLSRLELDTGRIAVILTQSFFTNKANKKLRKHIIDEDLLEAIITLPAGILPHTGVKVSIVVLNQGKRRELAKSVLFIEADKDKSLQNLYRKNKNAYEEVTQKLANNIIETYRSIRDNGKVKQFIAKQSSIEKAEYDLSPGRYDPKIVETIQQVKRNDKYSKLRHILKKAPTQSMSESEAGLKVVQISDLNEVGVDFYLNLDSIVQKDINKTQYSVLSESAILVARIGEKLKPTYFKYRGEKVAIMNNIYAFTVSLAKINVEYLITQLYSDFFSLQMHSIRSGVIIPYFSVSDFLELDVLIPSITEQINKVSAFKADQEVEGRIVSFIKEIQLVTKSEDIKAEVTRFAKRSLPNAENVVFRTEFDFEEFPFSHEDIKNNKLIQVVREYDENGDPLPDEDFIHYLLLDRDNSINGIITTQSLAMSVTNQEIDEINAYVSFLKKTREFITKQIAYDSLAKYAHTSKNFFLKLVGEINGIIDSENPQLKDAMETLYVASEKILDRKRNRGKEISDYLLGAKLEQLSKKISAYAKFYKTTDLNFKQITDGEFSTFKLNEVLADCKNVVGEFEISKPEEEISIYGKKEAIKQGFIDLIQNGIEYSSDSIVKIEITDHRNFVSVSISNGVSKLLPEETFNKLGQQWLTAQNDVGISKGLYWAKQAVENSNGQFEILPYKSYVNNRIFGITLKFKNAL